MNARKQQREERKQQSKSPSPPPRWAAWGQKLRERFERSWLRQPGLAMTLLQPRGLLCLHYHWWRAGTWNISPYIRLSISPLLEKTFWQGMEAGTAFVDRKSVVRLPWAKSETKGWEGMAAIIVPQFLRSQAGQPGGCYEGTHGLGWGAGAPLARVFARSKQEQGDGADDGTDPGSKCEVAAHALAALRVTRHYARREELVHRTLVTARPPAASNARTVEHREAVLEATPVARAGVKGRLGMETCDFDIDHLTDRVVRRIDGRFIAHRERLGRVF